MVGILSPWAMAALMALPWASAHINIKTPRPFNYDELVQDRSPLKESQYPCKFQSYTSDSRTQLAVGSSNTLEFYPSPGPETSALGGEAAVHNGGSCQLSITLDTEPTAKSVFKVFHSIEGGCPGVNGTTTTFQYTLPPVIPDGPAILAWTWFPVSSGAPEMYMNCAPITVTGGSEDDSGFNKLPDMFVANLGFTGFDGSKTAVSSLDTTVSQASLLAKGEIPQCVTEAGMVLELPDPGDSVAHGPSGEITITGKPAGQCLGGSSSSDAESSGSGTSSTQASNSASSVTSSATGGNFAETPSPSPTISTPSAAQLPTTLVTVTSPIASSVGATPAATPASLSSAAGTCEAADNGKVICNVDSQFGLCNSGTVVWQDLASGTVCRDGSITAA